MKRISVFISHRWRHKKDHDNIRNLLKKNNIPTLDFSVTRKKKLLDEFGRSLPALILEDKIKSRIERCNIFIVSARPNVKDAPWVMTEILLASAKQKYILAVRPKGEKKSADPDFITEIKMRGNGKIINFHSTRIIDTIYKVTNFDRDFVVPKRKKKKRKKKKSRIYSSIKKIKQYFLNFDKWFQNKF